MTKSIQIFLFLTVLFGLPPLGIVMSGQLLTPPLTLFPIPTEPGIATFSWSVLGILAVLILGTVAPFVWRFFNTPRQIKPEPPNPIRLPWWGWVSLVWVACSWMIAWNHFAWFQDWQHHTFPFLWFGYIVVVNALTYKRTGHCLMLDETFFFCKLFILSAGFWWSFEYLNQFVNNWHYLGIPEMDTFTSILFMTLSFSTVLPAVLGTIDYLASFPQLINPFEHWVPIKAFDCLHAGWGFFMLGCLGLLTIGIWPTILFPFLWLSPLLILVGLKMIWREETFLSSLTKGNWTPIMLSALATLICGGFWEMWNVYSLVHWEYTIPYVHAFKVFEMPILGYSGYLPFGLECVAVVRFFLGNRLLINEKKKKEAGFSFVAQLM